MARAVGFHAEDVTEPSEIIPALKRAFDENAKGRPAFLEFICSHRYTEVGWAVKNGVTSCPAACPPGRRALEAGQSIRMPA